MTEYRVIRAYGPWPKGHVFTAMPGNAARTLMARGMIEEIVPPGKAMKSTINRMIKVRSTRAMNEGAQT